MSWDWYKVDSANEHRSKLKEFVEGNKELVTVRKINDHLGIIKYRPRMFFEGKWNREAVMSTRGQIVDKAFNPYNAPLVKMFNRLEHGQPWCDMPRDEKVITFKKHNGFMIAATGLPDGRIMLNTTGSADENSEYIKMAKEYFTKGLVRSISQHPFITYTFECCHPNDPHIVPEEFGLYYIGARHVGYQQRLNMVVYGETPYEYEFYREGVKPVPAVPMRYGEAVLLAKNAEHEGLVIYNLDGTKALKVKSDLYRIKKLFARAKPESIFSGLTSNKAVTMFDEEYHGLIRNINENVAEFSALDEQAKLRYIERYLVEAP